MNWQDKVAWILAGLSLVAFGYGLHWAVTETVSGMRDLAWLWLP